MRLIIEIPDFVYGLAEKTNILRSNIEALEKAIIEGKPLPEGHGRLIDADAYKEQNNDILDCEIDHPKYQDTLRELIDNAPTIIEAESEGKE